MRPPRARLAALGLTVAVTGCAARDVLPPDPATAARAADRARAAVLRAHLLALPPITAASVVVDRAAPDPLARRPTAPPPTVAVALVADPAADRERLAALARAAAAVTIAADARVSVAVLPSPDRPDLARLGPFTVAAPARAPLLALVAGALFAVAALAGALAFVLLRQRRGRP
jgi:hypothetical protein